MSERMVDSTLAVDAWTEEARRLRAVAQDLGQRLDEAGLEVLSVHELRAARMWLERGATGRRERRWWTRGPRHFSSCLPASLSWQVH